MTRLQDGVVKTSSRGGGDYDIPMTYVLQDPLLIKFFEKYPSYILDGEIYIHGYNLQRLSGLCRKITLEEEHKNLEYHVYDIAGTDLVFKDRLPILIELQEFFKDSVKIKICEHVKTESWSDIQKLHDKWVADGYEGLVIRNPDKEYGYGKKDARAIKVKMFDDAEFTITGITEGLRDEDFVFNLLTDDGKAFEAKPRGTREQRQEYRDNLETIIGQKGTVKYFGFSPDGIPLLPIFKYVRYGDDNS